MAIDENSHPNLLQPVIGNIIVYTLAVENERERSGSYLRLVNHSFNDEVLRIWFITREANAPRPTTSNHSHNKLLACRHLQGFLLRHATVLSKFPSLATSIIESINHLRAAVPNENLPQISTDRCLGDLWHAFVCAAVVSLHRPGILRAIGDGRCPSLEMADHGREAWTLLSMCRLGSRELIQTSYATFDRRALTPDKKRGFLLSCLCTAIEEDWQDAFEFLLRLGLDLNAKDPVRGRHALRVATETGHTAFLKTLLDPKYGLRKDGIVYERSITSAANHLDLSTRTEMINYFFEHSEGVFSRRMRKEMVWGACRRNDVDLARLVLDKGDVDMFVSESFTSALHWRRCALTIAAENDSIACLRLILQLCSPEDMNRSGTTHKFEEAFQHAIKNRSLEMLKLLLPYQSDLSLSEQFLLAAQVDGGIAVIENLYAPDCLPRLAVPAHDTTWRGKVSSVGGEALRQAIRTFSSDNVEHLLQRGVTPSGTISISPTRTAEEASALRKITDSLARHGCPLF